MIMKKDLQVMAILESGRCNMLLSKDVHIFQARLKIAGYKMGF